MKLVDKFNRQISYLRVSVTEHCNYRCKYCRDESDISETLRKDVLRFEELGRIVKIFASLGVTKIRLTGGEPLLRKDIIQLVNIISDIDGLTDIPLSTNAHLLEKYAQQLKDSGINRLNISLDSLDSKKFADITRGGDLYRVINGINKAIEVGLQPIKINMVVMEGFNENEIEDMLDFCIKKDIQLRFIETMPIGMPGIEIMGNHYPKEKILEKIKKHIKNDLVELKNKQSDGPATQYKIAGTNSIIGIISAVSEHFCDSCNRVRLTAKGDLVLCLGQENSVSLKDKIREGASDETIRKVIIEAIGLKPEKHYFNEDLQNIELTNMVSIGG